MVDVFRWVFKSKTIVVVATVLDATPIEGGGLKLTLLFSGSLPCLTIFAADVFASVEREPACPVTEPFVTSITVPSVACVLVLLSDPKVAAGCSAALPNIVTPVWVHEGWAESVGEHETIPKMC